MSMTVIKFPKENPRATETSLVQVQEKIDDAKVKYINNLVDQHCSALLAHISLSGFDIEREDFMKDFAFTVETVRSSMMRNMGISHPLHEQIDEAMEVVDTEEGDDEDITFPSVMFDDEEDE